jgi:flagellar biosynthetic protein FlhB
VAEGQGAEDRTEAATEKRLRSAREEGRVPLSREAASAAGLAAAAAAFALALPPATARLAQTLSVFLANAHRLDAASFGGRALFGALVAAALVLAPVLLGILTASVAATLFQTGGLLSLRGPTPDFARIDPRAGLARLFKPETLRSAGASVLKVVAVGMALWRPVRDSATSLEHAPSLSPAGVMQLIATLGTRVILAVLVVQMVLAAADLFLVRRRHAICLRMSREEVRQERREEDGDPHVRARIRAIRNARAKRRMMAAVPTATVVVTNPTHYAVALAYDRATSVAPRVVAKGVDESAAAIRAAAEAARVPLVSNPPLARAISGRAGCEHPARAFSGGCRNHRLCLAD